MFFLQFGEQVLVTFFGRNLADGCCHLGVLISDMMPRWRYTLHTSLSDL